MAHVEDRWFRSVEGKRERTDRHGIGARYRVRYRAPDGRERYRSYERKTDADRFAAEVQTSMGRGEWIDPRNGRVTFERWSERWLATKKTLKPKTLAGYESLLKSRIVPRFGTAPIAGIGHLDVVEWVASMSAEGLSSSRTRQAYRVLAMALDAAVQADYLPRNPAIGVKLPKMPTTEMRFLDHGQIHDLADASGDDGLLIYLLAYTGLRIGEAFALRASRIHVLRGRITVAESLADVNGRLIFGPPKTHAHREVGIPRSLREPLAARLGALPPDGLVFADTRGGPLRYGNWRRRVWNPAVAAAGLEGLRPHELRHTCASLLIAGGADAKKVSRQLGHASVQITLDRYTHLFPDDLDELADRLDAASLASLASRARPKDHKNVIPMRRSSL
jgi:integrase